MTRTKPYKRIESAEGRAKCAAHAVSELFRWGFPPNAPDDWTPSAQQVIAKTNALYGWVTITEEEALAAIDAARPRHAAA